MNVNVGLKPILKAPPTILGAHSMRLKRHDGACGAYVVRERHDRACGVCKRREQSRGLCVSHSLSLKTQPHLSD